MTEQSSPPDPRRRDVLKCMAWMGAGLLWAVNGGVTRPLGPIGEAAAALPAAADSLHFVQISDSHIGFNKEANPDVTATLRAAVEQVNALPRQPSFVLHTGDVSHLSRPAEFDLASQVLGALRAPVFFVPGEHDVLDEPGGTLFRERFGKGTLGDGWYSFDHSGVHFVGLVNVLDFKAGGSGSLGSEQIVWLAQDLGTHAASTPIVVFTHIPLWPVYPAWGWTSSDAEAALAHLRRFGSVTVLNGHIHQVMLKVEGNVTFHTCMSTAYPQPSPGTAPAPGPMTVPAGELRRVLGINAVDYVPGRAAPELLDRPLVG